MMWVNNVCGGLILHCAVISPDSPHLAWILGESSHELFSIRVVTAKSQAGPVPEKLCWNLSLPQGLWINYPPSPCTWKCGCSLVKRPFVLSSTFHCLNVKPLWDPFRKKNIKFKYKGLTVNWMDLDRDFSPSLAGFYGTEKLFLSLYLYSARRSSLAHSALLSAPFPFWPRAAWSQKGLGAPVNTIPIIGI